MVLDSTQTRKQESKRIKFEKAYVIELDDIEIYPVFLIKILNKCVKK